MKLRGFQFSFHNEEFDQFTQNEHQEGVTDLMMNNFYLALNVDIKFRDDASFSLSLGTKKKKKK